MARCGCGGQCACVLNPGPGIAVDGTGTPTSPYVISATNADDVVTLGDDQAVTGDKTWTGESAFSGPVKYAATVTPDSTPSPIILARTSYPVQRIDTATSAKTLLLPATGSVDAGLMFIIKKLSSFNPLTIDPGAGGVIDNQPTLTLTDPYSSVVIMATQNAKLWRVYSLSPGPDFSWANIALGSGLVRTGVSSTPQYRLKSGVVYLHGQVSPSAGGNFATGATLAVGTMPVGFRPSMRSHFALPTSDASLMVKGFVDNDGSVVVTTGTTTASWFSLAAISYPADA